MNIKDIVIPIAPLQIGQCMITPPWFVEDTEYPPLPATYKPLVNGEEAFSEVYYAIALAQKSVDIICWGFQPSMYFIRDGKSPCIGELLVNIARKKGVRVRILGWEMPFNATGAAGEANLPGKGAIRYKDRAGQSATDKQYAYDRHWFKKHSYSGEWSDVVMGQMGPIGMAAQADVRNAKVRSAEPLFVGRGFGVTERAEIAYRAARQALDPDISVPTIGILTAFVTHHQKTVLVDYELPEAAIGFVMGHNMLDEYWDTDAHSSRRRAGEADACQPDEGPNGFLPRQDISCKVTGPILEHLHENFAKAWFKETRQNLLTQRNAKEMAKKLKPRLGYGYGIPVMAQLVRTQPQEDKRDIEQLYMKAVNNATQFIYIENQYFRWPPLAEAIKKVAEARKKIGKVLHLFVVTNVTDEGIGSGTVNTQRMLESLGRADTIPNVTKALRIKALDDPSRYAPVAWSRDPKKQEQINQEMTRKLDEYHNNVNEIKKSIIVSEDPPGLKVHICSLVAPDSPPDKWMPVYVHSKLMIIDDVFTTHGSANINTRSMQVDSEMNIAHDWASVTRDLRRRLWQLHTSGKGMQDDPALAFKAWEDLINTNQLNLDMKAVPVASLVKFYYKEPTLKDLD